MSDCCGGLLKERPSETVVIVSDGLLAQTLRTACVRSAHILLVEFRFHMGYGLLPNNFDPV
ncbi:carbamoyltransferase [Neisseria subflava]|uniref:carbamoyltransferase n=1 Tax=Neisseria TaxID=482 RepID=UPI00131CC660|nr:carbamoyltransferase [Neisseria subflava]